MAYGVEAVSPRDGFVVTKSDTVVFADPVAGLYVGGAGDVTVKTQLGTTLPFIAVPAGTILPIRCTQVLSTGTSATNITALVY